MTSYDVVPGQRRAGSESSEGLLPLLAKELFVILRDFFALVGFVGAVCAWLWILK